MVNHLIPTSGRSRRDNYRPEFGLLAGLVASAARVTASSRAAGRTRTDSLLMGFGAEVAARMNEIPMIGSRKVASLPCVARRAFLDTESTPDHDVGVGRRTRGRSLLHQAEKLPVIYALTATETGTRPGRTIARRNLCSHDQAVRATKTPPIATALFRRKLRW
jgi:hypothetical protein